MARLGMIQILEARSVLGARRARTNRYAERGVLKADLHVLDSKTVADAPIGRLDEEMGGFVSAWRCERIAGRTAH